MKLTILGYSGAYPTEKSGTTAYLLESEGYHLAIDMGSGGFLALKEHLNPLSLDALILSHYHGDHIADVGVLQYYRQLNQESGHQILPIYGHQEQECQFKQWTIPNVSCGYPIDEHSELDLGPFYLSFLRTIHPVPTFAMRIEEVKTKKVLVFTADSGYFDSLIDFSKESDVFLADTYFLNGNERNAFHLTAQETGEIGKKANVKKIIATHLNDRIDLQQLQKEIEEAAGEIPVLLAHKDLIIEI